MNTFLIIWLCYFAVYFSGFLLLSTGGAIYEAIVPSDLLRALGPSLLPGRIGKCLSAMQGSCTQEVPDLSHRVEPQSVIRKRFSVCVRGWFYAWLSVENTLQDLLMAQGSRNYHSYLANNVNESK